MTIARRTNPLVSVLGITFKEDVPDIRNSKVINIVRELERFVARTQLSDPLASNKEAQHEYGITLTPLEKLEPADAIILAVAHREYVESGWFLPQRLLRDGKGVVIDVKSRLDRAAKPDGIVLWRL